MASVVPLYFLMYLLIVTNSEKEEKVAQIIKDHFNMSVDIEHSWRTVYNEVDRTQDVISRIHNADFVLFFRDAFGLVSLPYIWERAIVREFDIPYLEFFANEWSGMFDEITSFKKEDN